MWATHHPDRAEGEAYVLDDLPPPPPGGGEGRGLGLDLGGLFSHYGHGKNTVCRIAIISAPPPPH